MPDNPELWEAVLPVIAMFETLAVPYCIGGSVASSFAGVVRATLDVDLVADIRLQQVEPLVVPSSLPHRKTSCCISSCGIPWVVVW